VKDDDAKEIAANNADAPPPTAVEHELEKGTPPPVAEIKKIAEAPTGPSLLEKKVLQLKEELAMANSANLAFTTDLEKQRMVS